MNKTKTKTITRKKLLDILQNNMGGIPNFIMDEIQGDKFTMDDIQDLENTLDYMEGEMNRTKEALRSILISQG